MRASETDRGLICPASLVLPRVERGASESRDRAAAYGTLVHWWKETGETDPSWADPRDTLLLEKKLLLTGLEREDQWPGGDHEVTYALNVFTLELLKHDPARGVSRDDWKAAFPPDQWLTGTIDWVGDRDGVPIVNDLKTGRWLVAPEDSGQLRSYSLFLFVEAGRPELWENVASITHWPKYKLADPPRQYETTLTGADLERHLFELKWSLGNPEDVNPSDDGCRFCAARPLCPAFIDGDVSIPDGYHSERPE